MGLASSQARMLLLTAQKSDLEYRAQMINQRKLNLGMRTQELAQKYSAAMSNRRLSFAYYTAGNTSTALKTDLSYSSLTAENGENAGTYLVTDKFGNYVCRNEADAAKAFERLSATGQATTDFATFKQESCTYYPAPEGGKSLLDNNDYFQDALRNGSLFLQQLFSDNVTGALKYNNIAYSTAATIYDSLDTSDDDAAQAEYESQSTILANQDKQLDLELQQIQTKHKAIETEYDSVKKVIEKNIEVSFKIFS